MEESKSREELIRQLNSLLATRDTGWSTFKTLTLAAYGYGEVTKWNLQAIKNEIKPLLRKLHAVIDCSIMTAPDWISRGSDRDHPLLLCKIRSGLQLLRSLSGLHDDDDDLGIRIRRRNLGPILKRRRLVPSPHSSLVMSIF